MGKYTVDVELDEDGEEIAVCPECEGTGKGEAHTFFDDPEADEIHCPVCCGFGRLDW